MLSECNYSKILDYFDRQYWGGKTTETNWNYYGITLDWYFENSVLCIDFLDIVDYFDSNGSFAFIDTENFSQQYGLLHGVKRLELIQNIFNILKHSTINKDQSNQAISVITKVLNRDQVKVLNPETGYIAVVPDDIIDSGSYCNIVSVNSGLLRKELKSIYQDDLKLQKRVKYEYENMCKLSGCPQILNVLEYDETTCSYLMEQADMNLAAYLDSEIDLPFEIKLKIIMDLIKGMAYAHNKSIIHRDLHLGNILKIGKDFVICDFGLSKDLSLERSMKSSYTEKNNHLFVDPLAITDFTKLDHKSDIYSIGKMMDYIMTYNAASTNHLFKTIVERCICRDKDLRYDSIEQIITDLEILLKDRSTEQEETNTITKLINGQYDAQVHEYIIDLVASDKLCKFIVEHKLYSFSELVLKFESIYQISILKSIENGFSDATGYGGWTNYDIFSRISYNLCKQLKDNGSKKISRRILEECAQVRFEAKNLLDKLPD